MSFVEFDDGIAIHGDFAELDLQEVADAVGKFKLTFADPPYGNILPAEWDQTTMSDSHFAEWMCDWTKRIAKISEDRSALYVCGGIGKPLFRPFYWYLIHVEHVTSYLLANHITWKKRRAYGVQHNYLFTREEIAYLHLGEDITKPLIFNVPLLSQLRGYAGYNEKYPAKSEFLRRTSVWDDVTEILRGKLHGAQKPVGLVEIPIQVHTNPGDWVLDPFAGSGSTAVAARKNDRRFVIVEKDAAIFEQLVTRLRSGSLDDVPSYTKEKAS